MTSDCKREGSVQNRAVEDEVVRFLKNQFLSFEEVQFSVAR